MKRLFVYVLCIVLGIVACMNFCGCSGNVQDTDLWQNALYSEDIELGEGNKTVTVDVVVMDKKVTFTIHSDKDNLGDALMEHKLIEGEKSVYGIYVKKVNGILADYDVDKTYWAFTKNGESMMTGVDGAEFKDQDKFELVYTK